MNFNETLAQRLTILTKRLNNAIEARDKEKIAATLAEMKSQKKQLREERNANRRKRERKRRPI